MKKRKQAAAAFQSSINNPLSSEELEDFFNNPPPDECHGKGKNCVTSGGRKPRKYIKKGSRRVCR